MDVYSGKRESVIDYVIVKEDLAEKIKRIEVKGQVDSDHHPVVVWITRVRRGDRGDRRGRGDRRCWDEVEVGCTRGHRRDK